MNPLDRQQLFSALMLAAMALFVASGAPSLGRWRRRLRLGAVALFALAMTAVLVEIGLWLGGLVD
ncbi:MAG TPA: hypothetical protein VME41_12825 [Stellaceae bacterium]|nr:hypothetical protein [Stellaceae bacterium]